MQGESDYIIITTSYSVIFDSIIVAVIITNISNAIVVKIFLSTVGSVRTVILRGEREIIQIHKLHTVNAPSH